MVEFRAEDNQGTIPVQEKHRIDVNALQGYLRQNIKGFTGPLMIEEFAGGQSNPTYLLTAGKSRYVMRRKPPGQLLKSAHAVDREYRVISALQETDVPVARTYALCTDESIIGTWFYVMEYLDGRVIWDSYDGPMAATDRREIWLAANQSLSRLHNVNFESVGLSDYGKHTDYIARQISRWAGQYEYTKTIENVYMDNLIAYLPKNIPEEDACTIVHGDYKIDNLMIHSERNEVIGILDWELSTLGNPLSDLAYLCRPYRDALRTLSSRQLKDRGIPLEEEYIEYYCKLTGRNNIPDWDYYLAFNMFRLAAILQGIARRVLDGTAASKQAEQAGAGALTMARLAWAQIDKSVNLDEAIR